jgi:phosphocarrier protein
MYEKIVKVCNPTGLHARPAADFVALASKYKSNIKLIRLDQPNKIANAKSIIFVLSLAIRKDHELKIQADGEDAQEAVDHLVKLVESGFGEI